MSNIINDKNKYLLLMYTISIASFMVNLDTYIVNVSLPTIADSFGTDTSNISWVVLSYNLMVVSLLLVFGKLGDKLGLKKMFTLGFLVFTISSSLCGISTSLLMLVIARFLQGIGASILYALPQAMITKYIPQEKRGMAFGILASSAALGITLGAPVGGLITGVLNWRWIFFINLPVGCFAIYHLLKILPKDFYNYTSKKPFDYIGAVFSFFSALFLTFYINKMHTMPITSNIMATVLTLAIIFTILFWIRMKNYKFALLDISVFKNLSFDFANISMFLLSAFLAGTNFLMPFYLYKIKNLTVTQVGFVFILYSISYLITSLISGKLSSKIEPYKLCIFSMLISTLNIIFFIHNLVTESLLATEFFLIICGISFSFFITSNNHLVMSMAKTSNAGMIAGIHRMTGRLGMLFGVVGFEAIFSIFSYNSILAFQISYGFGALICLLALICSIPFFKTKT